MDFFPSLQKMGDVVEVDFIPDVCSPLLLSPNPLIFSELSYNLTLAVLAGCMCQLDTSQSHHRERSIS